MTTRFLIAGFGGQGILFAGKFLVNKGMMEGKQVTWLPSYGPEMRGGTANCNVIISDNPVGSPIVQNPNVLMVMNTPSLDKYEKTVVPGGKVFVDSSLVSRKVERTDVEVTYIPATKMAGEMGIPTLANMILLGAIVKSTGCVGDEAVLAGLKKIVSAKHADLLDANLAAMQAGKDFVK